MAKADKWVYLFSQGSADRKDLLGGKGANLAEMTRLGLPVPPGFTVTTRACNAYLKHGGFPKGMWEQQLAALAKLEKQTKRTFGSPRQPLLLSCRSGAKFSMPGMMDTVLNLGINDEVAEAIARGPAGERFAFDAYRRLVQMFGTVVLGIADEPFEKVLAEASTRHKVANESQLEGSAFRAITAAFKAIVRKESGKDFPQQPRDQLRAATSAVFSSWNGKRAVDYRNAAGIAHDLGTAVNIQTMVFGNVGAHSATGVLTTRNVSTGVNELEGDYLTNAQGEDVVSGTRDTHRIAQLRRDLPKLYAELARYAKKLERHFREVQDIEFTIESGKLWMLQTRDAKRSAQAAVRIAVELANERRITKREALLRVTPEHVDFFLHPQFEPAERQAALDRGDFLAKGLNVSPGAAAGAIAFDADTAETWATREKRAVILVRIDTKPNDVHGMLASQGILTSRGGRTSHAALVARQFGKPAVVGATDLKINLEQRTLTVNGRTLKEGDLVCIDGTSGEVFAGTLKTSVPEFSDPHLIRLLSWADQERKLGVWANADYPHDAERARRYGAEGIGLCRTEHMFFEPDRLPIVQKMILAADDAERSKALAKLLPIQRADFEGLFRAMSGLPVTIRLLDPPLHEFLPNHDDLLKQVAGAEVWLRHAEGAERVLMEERLAKKRVLLAAVEGMREQNPMLGLRGVRLGIHLPQLVRMQVRAMLEAAIAVKRKGIKVHLKIMIPLTAHSNELRVERALLEDEARRVMAEQKTKVAYQFGTMIEVPRAALTADQIAEQAEFFSFGTNDLTQTTFGLSRDDAESGFLLEYLERKILPDNPFATLDIQGVGKLVAMGVQLGRKTRPGLEVGICGEHGGDPRTIAFCHQTELTYVSCSPYRVPIARLAAAQAALRQQNR